MGQYSHQTTHTRLAMVVTFHGNWQPCVLTTVVNLSNDTSIRGSKAHAVTNRSLPLMFQYQKRSTTDSLLQMVTALQFAVAELAHMPADHASDLGHLLNQNGTPFSLQQGVETMPHSKAAI